MSLFLHLQMKKLQSNRTSVFNVSYHVIFCPKYRRKVLVSGVDVRLKVILQEKAEKHGVFIEKLEVMPDHVHLFIRSNPKLSIHSIVSKLKGYSAFILRKEFPYLKSKLPCLWTRSYYVETIGSISEKTIKQYIENQKYI